MLTATPPSEPTAEEAAQSGRVTDAIRERLAAAGGWIPFSAFMQTALYAPQVGYYMGDRPIFGAAGDFVTGPELSPLYAACVANGLADLLARAGGGDIVELGGGSGRFAAEVAGSLLQRGAPLERYRLVETSPFLAARQRALIARHPGTAAQLDRFDWLDGPPRAAWRGVAFANEVVDALPVDRFRIGADGVESIGVTATNDGFAWRARAADAALAAAVESLQSRLPSPMPAGFVSELRPAQRAWLESVLTPLLHGALLVVDYGLPRAQYYHPSRDGGTLCAFRRHQRVDHVLANAGIQDLTAWVDFSALADDAGACDFEIAGFATQAHYLLSAGIERELAGFLESAGERDRLALRQQAETLLLPGEMGERFKVMALTRGLRGSVAGFGFRDLASSL